MTKTSKTIVFFGNERLATGVTTTAPTLRALIEAGYHVAAVVSNFVPGQSRNARTLEVEAIAKEHKIPLLLPTKPADIIDQLKSYDAEAGILAAYGKIVPQSVIDIFPKGIVNIHPSLLPLHRGPTPIESVILNAEQKTGVSIMALAKEMDAGPVYAQSEYPLTGKESKQELVDTLQEIGKSMLLEVLPGILEGTVVALPQDGGRASYDQLIAKQDGIINDAKAAEQSAAQIEREIRAYAGWPQSRMLYTLQPSGFLLEAIITKAHVVHKDAPAITPGKTSISTSSLYLGTKDGVLEIDALKPSGKNEMSVQAFLAGRSHKL